MTDILLQTLHCLWKFLLYIVPCVIVLLSVYKFCHVPGYIFRKLLHLIAFSCVTLMILSAETWMAVVCASLTVMIVVYPILSVLEKRSWYGSLFVQKSPGEIKRSLLMLFGMFAVITAFGWGLFDSPEAVSASILMWGTGDAAAALVGIPHGNHKVKFADGKKSWEGTLAMFFTATAAGILVFLVYKKMPLNITLMCILPAAAVGAFTELITSSEYDTVTVPSAVLAMLLISLSI